MLPEDHGYIPGDHGYSSKSLLDTQTVDQSHLISDLKTLKEATSCEDETSGLLQEVRLQSASLISGTASFGSVLYRYRDISRLEREC